MFDENKALASIYSGDSERVTEFVRSCDEPEAAKEWLSERILCLHTEQAYCVIAEALAELEYNAAVKNIFKLAFRCLNNNWQHSYSRVIRALSFLDFAAYSQDCVEVCRNYVSEIKQSADELEKAKEQHIYINLNEQMEEVRRHMSLVEDFLSVLEQVIEDTAAVYRRRNIGFTGNVK
ncbi:MAG: hypothetical protein J5999_09185 [Oscillospiraceae bacterium]|nr:hypothetical protein [Oscillospiraceae bacterium]